MKLVVNRDAQAGKRAVGGILAVLGVIAIIYSFIWSPQALVRKYRSVSDRQGYVSGFGLGEYLKNNQSGRQVAIVRVIPTSSRDRQVIMGLKDGLAGSLKIVAEHEIDISKAESYQEASALLTTGKMVELKSSGADIVLSFIGIPLGVLGGAFDFELTKELWQSPEYSAFQWVLPYRPEILPKGCFKEGRVLAMVQEKPQPVSGKGFTSSLKIKGKPAELFNAWFELVTKDDGG